MKDNSININIKILLVEASSSMLKLELKSLENLGFTNIIKAKDGNDAITKLSSGLNPELIISGWNMPGKNGYELLLWVRSKENFRDLPFLLITESGGKEEIKKARQAGASSLIIKPFNDMDLKEGIDEAFGFKINAGQRRIPEISASGKVVLKAAHIQITDHLVLGVLKRLIEKGELSPKYFELETECMPGWNNLAGALETGAVDAACILAPIAMELFNSGVPISLVLLAHRNGSIFVRNKTGIDDPGELSRFFKNKSFYIPHTMSVHNALAHMFFNGIGIKPEVSRGENSGEETAVEENAGVALEVVPIDKMPEFMDSNLSVAGYFTAEPFGTVAIASGIAEFQFLSGEMWKNHPCCVVTVQKDFINRHADAVYEFTEMLVYAGKYIDLQPGFAAEMALDFLDPDRSLGLKVPLLKNVLMEPFGIKTNDLYPELEDLDRMQHYMHDQMGLGSLIDLKEFVDQRFANRACRDRSQVGAFLPHDSDGKALEILNRRLLDDIEQKRKSLLNKEGKYLMFMLGSQEFGIDILKIKEIIKMIPVRSMPQAPEFIRGIIDLRGKVFPVVDLKLLLGMSSTEQSSKTVIVVIEIETPEKILQVGVIADAVSEVADIKSIDIVDTPEFGTSLSTDFISGLFKTGDTIKILLNIDRILKDL